MADEIKDLINRVSVDDILAQPTQARIVSIDKEPSQIDSSDFSSIEYDLPPKPQPEIEEQPEPEEPYDAKVEATKLVGLISAGHSLIHTPIATWKLRQKRGGKPVFERMKAAYQKDAEGKALTDEEKRLVSQFHAYKSDLALMGNEIPYSQSEIDMLTTAAIPYMESSRMKINGGFAFWGVLAGIEANRLLKILTA